MFCWDTERLQKRLKPELWGTVRKGDFQGYWAAVRCKVTEPSCWPQMPTLEVQRAPRNAAKKQHPCRAGCLGVREATAHAEGDVVKEYVSVYLIQPTSPLPYKILVTGDLVSFGPLALLILGSFKGSYSHCLFPSPFSPFLVSSYISKSLLCTLYIARSLFSSI